MSYVPGLSVEDGREMEIRLDHLCKLISRGEMDPRQELPDLPGVQFALETAIRELETAGNDRNTAGHDPHAGGRSVLWESDFTRGERGIPVNGLVWMGDRPYMLEQVKEKLAAGFRVLKMKVGAIDFRDELKVLGAMREAFDETELEIRLDANGAWKAWEAPEKLERLAVLGIHSIEQPLAPGQGEAMAALCKAGIIPIALDEELIGVTGLEKRRKLLAEIRPRYIILKPGLLGGFSSAREWMAIAEAVGAQWWITSALESNIGLNAIAQWTATLETSMPQGLGTGSLYRNNIDSPLEIEGDLLWYRVRSGWSPLPEPENRSAR